MADGCRCFRVQALNANPYADPQQALKHWHKELQDLAAGALVPRVQWRCSAVVAHGGAFCTSDDDTAAAADDGEPEGEADQQPDDAMDYTADNGGEALLLAPTTKVHGCYRDVM